MKRLIFIFYLILPLIGLSQSFQYIGTTTNIVKARGGLMSDSALYLPILQSLSDTINLNTYDRLGDLIFIRNVSRVYQRDTIEGGGHKWSPLVKAAGTTNDVQFNTNDLFDAVTKFKWLKSDSQLFIQGSADNSGLRLGALESQSFSPNNNFICNNSYYNSGFKYRSNGFSSKIHFLNGGFYISTAPNGNAGNSVSFSNRLVITQSGSVGIGRSVDESTLSGSTLLFDASTESTFCLGPNGSALLKLSCDSSNHNNLIQFGYGLTSFVPTHFLGSFGDTLFKLTRDNYNDFILDSNGHILINSNTDNGERFQVNGTSRFNGLINYRNATLPPSTYNVLVHGLTDSIIYQVPVSSISSSYTFNSGITNTSNTVRWNGALLESPTIDGGSSFSPTFTSTRTAATVTINNTSTGRGLDVSTSTGIGVRSVTTTGISLQGIATGNYGVSAQSTSTPALYAISNGASGAQIQTNPTSTNNNQSILEVYRLSQSAGANNISGSIDMYINNTSAAGITVLANQFISKLPTATSTAETSQLIIKGINSGSQNTLATFDGNANATFGTTNSIVGTATNNNAVAGNIGENVESYTSTYTNYTTTATYQAIDSITLTAGDWDIDAFATFSSNSATITAAGNAIFVISTTRASASGALEGKNIAYVPQAALLGTSFESISIAPYRVSLSSTTKYYLNSQAAFTIGNPQVAGGLHGRRPR